MSSLQIESLEVESLEDTFTASVVNDQGETCFMCCTVLDATNSVRLSCCNQQVHRPCMNKHGLYSQREHLKREQCLTNFKLTCLLCKQPCDFDVSDDSNISFPESIPSLPSMSMPSMSISSLGCGDGPSDNDPSYVPPQTASEPTTKLSGELFQELLDQEVENTSLQPEEKLCLVCCTLVKVSDATKLACCGHVVHSGCNEAYVNLLKGLGMNSLYRGPACTNCSVSRYMVKQDFACAQTALEKALEDGSSVALQLHPLGCSPNTHYLLSAVVFHIYGFRFQSSNPWCIGILFHKYPELEAEIDRLKKLIIQSAEDIQYVRGIVTNIGNTRNVFISPEILHDVVNRAGKDNVDILMKIIEKIHNDCCAMFPDCEKEMETIHKNTVKKVTDAFKDSNLFPPKHMCLKPDSCMCVGHGVSVAPPCSPPRPVNVVQEPMSSPLVSHQASHANPIVCPESPLGPHEQRGSSPRRDQNMDKKVFKKELLRVIRSNSDNKGFDIGLVGHILEFESSWCKDKYNWTNVSPLMNRVMYDFESHDWIRVLDIMDSCGADMTEELRDRKRLRVV